jgi:CHAD domain-containing protein
MADQELDFAMSRLASSGLDTQASVHQCRKAIKRLRALIRIADVNAGVQRCPVDRRLRKAARILAPTRDASELARTIHQLLLVHPNLDSQKDIEESLVVPVDADGAIGNALARLDKVRSRLPAVFAAGDAWFFARVAAGIEATYTAAAADMQRLSKRHSDKHAHAWRKDVQCLSSQLQIIEVLRPGFRVESMHRISELADALGKHNDLAVLRAELKARRRKLPKKTRAALLEAAKAQQKTLREHAFAIGADLFSQSPDAFRRSLLSEYKDAEADSSVMRPTS